MSCGARVEIAFNPVVKVNIPSVAPVSIVANPVSIVNLANEYTGDYEFTPNDETQIIEIANRKATENIIINPVPFNYGRIDWNGTTITVY